MTPHQTAAIDPLALLGVPAYKTVAPTLRTDTIEPTRALERMATATTPVVTIVAGAGYGKSTVMAAWAAADQRPTAWLSLDPGDNDPLRLMSGVAAALGHVAQTPALLRAARSIGTRRNDDIAAALAGAFAEVAPFALLLDDAHVITDDAACSLLALLLDAVPTGCTFVLSGRSTPHVRTARRGLSGQLTSLTSDDLQLRPDESIAFLRQTLPGIGRADARRLADRTEGWPAGLRFVAMGYRGAERHAEPGTPERARDRPALLSQYFHQEFLRALPDDDRHFLLHTSVLDRLTGPLCDWVSGANGSAARLERIAGRGNPFIVSLGDTGDYRYHHLFREMLLDDLRSLGDIDESELRRRAIEFYERSGEWRLATEQALHLDDPITAGDVFHRHLFPAIAASEVASIGRWLERFTPTEIRRTATLSVVASFHSIMTGRRPDIERWLSAAELAGYEGPLPDGSADLSVAVAAARMLAGSGGASATLANAELVLDADAAVPGAGGRWAPTARLLDSATRRDTVPEFDSRVTFEAIEFESRGVPILHALANAHLALDSIGAGSYADAHREISEATDEISISGLDDLSLIALVFCVQALVDAMGGAMGRSLEASDHAIELIRTAIALPDRAQIHLNLVLADAALTRGDRATATECLDEADKRLRIDPDVLSLHQTARQLHARSDARRALGPVSELTPAEQRILEQLAGHRTLAEIGDHLYVSRNTVKTHTVSIYRKLVVSGRSEAVERAVELGLLAGEPERRTSSTTTSRR